MDTVPPPPALEVGAETPGEIETGLQRARKEAEDQIATLLAAQQPAGEAAANGGPAATTTAAEEPHVEAQVDQEVYDQLIAEGASERVARAKAKSAYVRKERARLKAEQS